MNRALKSAVKSAFRTVGLDVRRANQAPIAKPASVSRPTGDIASFLEDIRARGFAPRGIIDVGANRGQWTRLALSIFPETPIIMVEPQAEMVAYLSPLSKTEPACYHVQAGVGREPGELVQTIWPDLAGSSFLPALDGSLLSTGQQRKTPITTIDKLLSETYSDFVPDLVKLDIQGFELEALSGAQKLFGQTEVFVIETSLFQFMPAPQPITREVVSFMSERGYEIYDITDFFRRPSDGALGQVDLAFVKANGRFRESKVW